MKFVFAALLAVIPTTLAETQQPPITNVTLTRCASKESHKHPHCKQDKKRIIFPVPDSDTLAATSHLSSTVLLEWNTPYTLDWKAHSKDNVTFHWGAGDDSYSLIDTAVPIGDTSFDFIFKKLAANAITATNMTKMERQSMVLGQASMGNLLSLRTSNPIPNDAYIGGIYYDILIQPKNSLTIWQQEIEAQQHARDTNERAINKKSDKKWRLGVGIGVGIGVPILMAASYLAGRAHKGKKYATMKS